MDVDGFVAFALDTYEGTGRLPEWRALQRRRRVGARLSPYVPMFLARVVRRRLQHESRYRRWSRVGV